MFRKFYPSVLYDSAFNIDFQKYYDLGFRTILFDTDNTLVGHDAPSDDRAVQFFKYLRDIGFSTCIVSNNTAERVKPFADDVGTVYEFLCAKPKTDGYFRAMERLNVSKSETMMVGDQLFTDIWGANRAGIFSVFTVPIGKDPIFTIKLKRIAEKIVFLFYKGYVRRHPTEKYVKKNNYSGGNING